MHVMLEIRAWADPSLSKTTVSSRLRFVTYYRTLLLCAAILSLFKIEEKWEIHYKPDFVMTHEKNPLGS